MRHVITRVFPDPAPANTKIGPPGCITASRCSALRSSREEETGMAFYYEVLPHWRGGLHCIEKRSVLSTLPGRRERARSIQD